jgi:hypothetical protein
MKQQTKTYIFIRSLFAALLAVMSLASHAQEADSDSTVNVIGWFCNHDTIVYSQREQELTCMDKDTTMVSDITRRYHIAVVDSTAKGFLMEYRPLSIQFSDSTGVENEIKLLMARRLQGVVIRFSTDEMGSVKQIENYKEVRDAVYSRCDSMVSEIYAANPLLYGKISKPDMLKNIHKRLEDTYGSKQRLLEKMDALTLLFSNHGRCFEVGEHESNDGATKANVMVKRGKAEADDETATDEDYQIANRVQVSQNDGKATDIIIFTEYFSDGWPRYVYFSNEESDSQHVQTSIIEIEWESRAWE